MDIWKNEQIKDMGGRVSIRTEVTWRVSQQSVHFRKLWEVRLAGLKGRTNN